MKLSKRHHRKQVAILVHKFMVAVLKARFQAEAVAVAADQWDRGSDFGDCEAAAAHDLAFDDETDIVQDIPGDVVS